MKIDQTVLKRILKETIDMYYPSYEIHKLSFHQTIFLALFKADKDNIRLLGEVFSKHYDTYIQYKKDSSYLEQ